MDVENSATEHNPEPTKKRPANQNSRWGDTISTIAFLAFAPILALFLTYFVFQSYQVDGPSMEATLQHKDRLIVTKTGKTWSRITGSDYIPKRYEIIIFNYAGETGPGSQVNEKQLIKRVIGLPGDRIEVKDSVVTVYNSEHPDGFLVDREGPEKDVIRDTPTGAYNSVTVQPGEIFVMGDNRENSLDSRAFGPVKSQDIVGKLNLRIYPFNKADRF